jgi:hypothetical protein
MENSANKGINRYDKIKQNEEKLSQIYELKSSLSNPFYKDAKIVTCSQVLVKNGQAVAIAFKGSPKPKDHGDGRSSERASLSQ